MTPTTTTNVPFLDLRAQYLSIKAEIDEAIAEIIRTHKFILGSEETKFERAFAAAARAPHAVGCSCGTSALFIALKALDVRWTEGRRRVGRRGSHRINTTLCAP